MRSLLLGAAMLGAATLAAAPAAAQAGKTDTTMNEARLRFDEGIKLADAGDHEAARLKFNQAWALLKSPSVLYNLARAEQLSNHPVEALEHYRLFGKMASDPKVTEAQKQRAAENLAELAKKVGQIDVEAAGGARITIDGHPVEWTPGADPFPVTTGKHVVEATAADGKTRNLTVDCEAGTITKAKLAEAAATAPAPAPPPPSTPPPSTAAEPPPPEASGFWTTGRIAGAGVAGAGLVALGVGVVFQLKIGSADDAYTTALHKLPSSGACAPPVPAANQLACSDVKTKLDDVKSLETPRTLFLISGGVLLLGGAALFLLSSPSSSSKRAVRLAPVFSAREAGLFVAGGF